MNQREDRQEWATGEAEASGNSEHEDKRQENGFEFQETRFGLAPKGSRLPRKEDTSSLQQAGRADNFQSEMWTRRHNPEWKPRRASVASCKASGSNTCLAGSLLGANRKHSLAAGGQRGGDLKSYERLAEPCAGWLNFQRDLLDSGEAQSSTNKSSLLESLSSLGPWSATCCHRHWLCPRARRCRRNLTCHSCWRDCHRVHATSSGSLSEQQLAERAALRWPANGQATVALEDNSCLTLSAKHAGAPCARLEPVATCCLRRRAGLLAGNQEPPSDDANQIERLLRRRSFWRDSQLELLKTSASCGAGRPALKRSGDLRAASIWCLGCRAIRSWRKCSCCDWRRSKSSSQVGNSDCGCGCNCSCSCSCISIGADPLPSETATETLSHSAGAFDKPRELGLECRQLARKQAAESERSSCGLPKEALREHFRLEQPSARNYGFRATTSACDEPQGEATRRFSADQEQRQSEKPEPQRRTSAHRLSASIKINDEIITSFEASHKASSNSRRELSQRIGPLRRRFNCLNQQNSRSAACIALPSAEPQVSSGRASRAKMTRGQTVPVQMNLSVNNNQPEECCSQFGTRPRFFANTKHQIRGPLGQEARGQAFTGGGADSESGTEEDEDQEREEEIRGQDFGGDGEDSNLALIIESWLDDNPSFVEDYFMRKASRQLIDDWLIAHAKVSNTNVRGAGQQAAGATSTTAAASAKHSKTLKFNEISELTSAPTDWPTSGQAAQLNQARRNVSFGSIALAGGQKLHQFATSSSSCVAGSALNASNLRHHHQVVGLNSDSSCAPDSGSAAPIRKISATDFESRTGNTFLRPMLSTTPDGRPTFLSQPSSASSNNSFFGDSPASSSIATSTATTTLDDQQPTETGSKISSSERGGRRKSASIAVNRQAPPLATDICDSICAKSLSENELTNLLNKTPALACMKSGEIFAPPFDQVNELTPEADGEDNLSDGDAESTKTSHSDTFDSKEEIKLIFELVKNICNDLDIRTLLHKILKNIALLINADKSSLFLVSGSPGDPNRHLVSQLFNVDQDSDETNFFKTTTTTSTAFTSGGQKVTSDSNNVITIPWGKGLVGYVAESGESLNIENCYEDPRFTSTIDQLTGYKTKHMLCAPIFDKSNEIVGVAQVINKRDGNPFSRSDELKFKRYLQFCGIGLRNAQSYEYCKLENKRNQVLLDLAKMVFEEQSTIEQVVYRIMLHTQSLLECQRCQVLLIDDGSDDLDQLLQLTQGWPMIQKDSLKQQRLGAEQAEAGQSSRQGGQQNSAPKWKPQCSQMGNSKTGCPADTPEPGGSEERDSESSAADVAQRPEVKKSKLFSLVFDLECDGNDFCMHNNKRQQPDSASQSTELKASRAKQSGNKFPINIGITGYVAMTGETLNIEDAYDCERFDKSVDEGTGFRHKSILCMPIRNGQRQIIGVSQLINKKNGRSFNKNDENLFEAFAIFCGLGIHNTLMYEKVLKIMAKQRVTFEVLSYHATAPLEEAKKLHAEQVPSCYSLNLSSLKFNDFSLDEKHMLKSCLRFFLDLDLIRRFQIDQLVFCNWILSVQKNYRKVTYHPIVGGDGLKASPVLYHNWRHAFNVSQMMFAILINTQICQALGELETLALLIACLCHDLDHRGTNNSFQIKSASPLAQLYSTSTMEHHHFDQCVMILNSQGNQILAKLSPHEYSRVIVLLEEAILATDLANYFQRRENFFQLVNGNRFEWKTNLEHRSLLRCMLMTACDVAAITKPWPVQKIVADLVMSEFYQQGDIEKNELNIEPIDMMNRDKMSKLPEMQIGFIDTICAPIYVAFAKQFPRELGTLLEGCLANREIWLEIGKKNLRKLDNPQETKAIKSGRMDEQQQRHGGRAHERVSVSDANYLNNHSVDQETTTETRPSKTINNNSLTELNLQQQQLRSDRNDIPATQATMTTDRSTSSQASPRDNSIEMDERGWRPREAENKVQDGRGFNRIKGDAYRDEPAITSDQTKSASGQPS